jgi:hypothetical protein
MTKIPTFEEACAFKGIDPTILPDVSKIPEEYAKPIIAHFKLMVITEATNAGWKADYKKSNDKYYPWAWVKEDKSHPTGFGFSFTYCHCAYTHTPLGSRLAFETAEKAEAALEFHADLYKDFWLA